MKGSYAIDEFKKSPHTKPENSIYISYSQFSIYSKCPLAWKLKYIDKIKLEEPSIHTMFGNAMHIVIQEWLRVLFTETVKAADAMDFNTMLLNAMKQCYAEDVDKYKKLFSNKEELSEFYTDGLEILNYLKKKRLQYIDRAKYELVGTEIPLLIPPDENKPKVLLMGFLDVVFREKKNKNKFYILDLKTSTKGWSKWDKEDEIKRSQLILYKTFFAKQFGLSADDIEVEFFILRRKIDSDSMYPTPRIQIFKPSQGSITQNKVKSMFASFLDNCFVEDGKYNVSGEYRAICGNNGFNCKFCDFKDLENLCPSHKRVPK